MQLNPAEISDLIRSRIEGLNERARTDAASSAQDNSRTAVTVILDSERVLKIAALRQALSLDTKADALAFAIDVATDVLGVVRSGGRVSVEAATGGKRYLTIEANG